MARLTDKQRSELKHIRNEAYKHQIKYGYEPRHPNKPAPEYKARANCVRLDSGLSRRPDKNRVNCSDALPVCPAIESAKKLDNDLSDFKKRLKAMGMTQQDWSDWREFKKTNPLVTLKVYRLMKGFISND